MKINSKRVEYDGHVFDSQTECDFYIHMSNSKLVSDIVLHPTYLLMDAFEIPSIVTKTGTRKRRKMEYTPDLECTIEGKGRIAFDVKGSRFAISKDFPLRRKLFEQKYGRELVVAIYSKKKGVWEFS